ncbi:MAG: pentapeptide repeat-containing protein, partial [Chloroflexales bacterium]
GGANLTGANLGGANLTGAYLGGANLTGAYLNKNDWKLVGDRPYFSVSPIGSRGDSCSLWLTTKGPWVRAGCFWNTLEAFAAKVESTHGDNIYGQEYRAVIALLNEHVRLWTPAKTESAS